MKLLATLIFFVVTPTCFAQVTVVTGTVKDTNGVPYAGASIKAQLVLAGAAVNGQPTVTVTGVQACRSSGFGSSPCQVPFQGTTGPFTLDSTGSFSQSLQDNALVTPASTQWLFSVTISPGVVPPAGTGPQSCSATLTISGVAQSVTSAFSACPTLLVGGVSPNSPVVLNVKSSPYNAAGNTQTIMTGVFTVAGGVGGCPAGAPGNFCIDIPSSASSSLTAADIGSIIYGNEPASGLNRITPGAIQGVFDGTGGHSGEKMVTTLGTLPSGCGGGCIIVWGKDDTAALNAAAAVAKASKCNNPDAQNSLLPACVVLYFPPGGYMTAGGGTGNPAGFPGVSTGQIQQGTSWVGDGMTATIFYLRPDYSIGSLGNGLGIFLANGGDRVRDFGITSSGFNFNFVNNPVISTNCSRCAVDNVRITNTGSTTTIGAGAGGRITSFGHTGTINNLVVQDPPVGSVAAMCGFNAGQLDVFYPFCSNGGCNLLIENYTGGTSSSRITIHGGFIDEGGCTCPSGVLADSCVSASKDVSFVGTTLTSGAANTAVALSVDATSEVRCSSCTIVPFGSNGGSGVDVKSGGVFRVSMSKMLSNSSGAGGFLWNCATPTSCIDNGGNNYILNGAAVYLKAGSAVPYASLSHTWNTCYLTITPIVNATTYTICNQFLDQGLNLIHIKASSQNVTTCATAPIVTLTDGAGTATLTLTSGAATWDSGVITTTFAQGGTLTVKYDTAATSACATPPTNLSVTYNMQAFQSP